MPPTTQPLIVQSDWSILADTHAADYEEVRPLLAQFAELERSPEHMHFYRMTPLSLWNAAASGWDLHRVLDVLSRYSRFTLPANLVTDIAEYLRRYGVLELVTHGETLLLRSADAPLLDRICADSRCQPLLGPRDDDDVLVEPGLRGELKQVLTELGYPPKDLAGYVSGDGLALALRPAGVMGEPFALRPYQQAAVELFYDNGAVTGGSGVVLLPCGGGKTVVGLGVIAAAQTSTLILCPNTVAVRQWIREILDKTTLTSADVGEYSSEHKDIRPITVATYQIMTYRPQAVNKDTGEVGEFPHMQLFHERNWGLLIYDEVHLLPAPVFRATAGLQARRRLGLTATLIREDGRERDVFALIGPKKYEMPWQELQQIGFIAPAECVEVRVTMDDDRRMEAAIAETQQEAYRIAAENPAKLIVTHALVHAARRPPCAGDRPVY